MVLFSFNKYKVEQWMDFLHMACLHYQENYCVHWVMWLDRICLQLEVIMTNTNDKQVIRRLQKKNGFRMLHHGNPPKA